MGRMPSTLILLFSYGDARDLDYPLSHLDWTDVMSLMMHTTHIYIIWSTFTCLHRDYIIQPGYFIWYFLKVSKTFPKRGLSKPLPLEQIVVVVCNVTLYNTNFTHYWNDIALFYQVYHNIIYRDLTIYTEC